MDEPRQHIRFCTSVDGARIAYAVSGRGLPLFVAPRWLTHLEFDWRNPIYRPWHAELGRERMLVRMDLRGNGMSDRSPPSLVSERWLDDMQAVVQAARLQRFDLFGSRHGGTLAIAYAARYPERVNRLVLYCAQARAHMEQSSPAETIVQTQAIREAIRLAWEKDDPAYRHVLAMKLMPNGTPEEQHALNELLRVAAHGETALRLLDEELQMDVRHEASSVRCPTLVFQIRSYAFTAPDEGSLIASLIPGAELVTLDSPNYFLRQSEPAWQRFCTELRSFLSANIQHADGALAKLTEREAEVLELMAHGQDNAQIAARLGLSASTVRNHITSLFDKLQVTNRAQAIVLAREAGYARRPL